MQLKENVIEFHGNISPRFKTKQRAYFESLISGLLPLFPKFGGEYRPLYSKQYQPHIEMGEKIALVLI